MFKFKKKEVPMTGDEKEEKKADKDVDEKGADSQTKKDREDESVAAQERESDAEDSQTAKDRIDESEGAEKSDEKRDEGKKEGGSEELRSAIEEAMKPLYAEIAGLREDVAKIHRSSTPVGDDMAGKLNSLANRYGG